MRAKQKIAIINVISIIMLVICLVLCGGLVILSTSKEGIEIVEKSVEELQKNYTSTEDASITNTWDISATENDNVIATLSDDGTLTISGTGNMKSWITAADWNKVDWNEVDDKIKNVIIENGVTNIGCYAFEGCQNLISIEIPESVTNIGWNVFGNSINHTSINVNPNNTTYMDDNGVLYTKDGSKILRYPAGKTGEYRILDGTNEIYDNAFAGCYKLNSVEIPKSVTSICENIDCYFMGCTSLESIEVHEDNPNYMDDNGVLYTKDGSEILRYPEGKTDKEYTILDQTYIIEDIAFYGCVSLEKIYIPKITGYIGNSAFYGCDNLTIICHKESTAETYAQENEIDYLIIMDGINPKTTVDQLKQNLGTEMEYEIKDRNGEVITETAYVATGSTVEMKDGENYIIIVTGDCNGDGKSDIQDIFAINKYRLNNGNLLNEYLLAGDVNGDGKTNVNDIFEINKYRLGKMSEL